MKCIQLNSDQLIQVYGGWSMKAYACYIRIILYVCFRVLSDTANSLICEVIYETMHSYFVGVYRFIGVCAVFHFSAAVLQLSQS